jgi:hypothetical protein
MHAAETITGLARFTGRGPGTDAERRAAGWLARDIEAAGRDVRTEPFWCRPNWAFAHAWHVALGLAGSLLAVSHPRVGGALVLVALVSVIADDLIGLSVGRRLTPERASQNVVAAADASPHRVRLIVTATYDAGRAGLAYRDGLRAPAARLRRATGGLTPGWLGWVAIALAWLLAIAIVRLGGTRGTAIGLAQLPPTVGLVLGLTLLLELASSDYGPAAGDNGSGVAVALALVRALDTAPPARLGVEVVLAAAGEGGGIGLRRYLRSRRGRLEPANAIVLGIAACGAGRPRWWLSDGQLLALRYHARLRGLCAHVADDEAHLGATVHRGRGATPARPARIAGLPAIAIGCLDERGLVPRSHQSGDVDDAVDPESLDATLALALALVDAIDAEVGRTAAGAGAPQHRARRVKTPAAAARD